MVHDPIASTESRRQRARVARQREFLRAARELAETEGLESLTIKALAERLDCAVGSLYTYFPSKDALLATMQADAIATLVDAFDRAAARLRPHLDHLAERDRVLVELVAFGRCLIAAESVYPQELHLQQRLLAQPRGISDPDEVARVVPVAFDMLERPRRLLEQAARAGALDDDADNFDRTVTWVAALNGVAMVGAIQQHPDVGLFDVALLADRLNLDLLAGWGADRLALERAAEGVSPRLVHELLAP